ncbi:hypothetical protein ACIBM8_28940, partial [Micromonospora aurantiaca]|uniref:hypothetical protein n=1 Tax=Micromonospora aurantiaca (nom. illeg.) TaxID=47850 RepID=UPI0037A79065
MVQAESVTPFGELSDVAREDRDEEGGYDRSGEAAYGLSPSREQGQPETDLDHPGGDDDEIGVEREPGGHLRQELLARDCQVGDA